MIPSIALAILFKARVLDKWTDCDYLFVFVIFFDYLYNTTLKKYQVSRSMPDTPPPTQETIRGVKKRIDKIYFTQKEMGHHMSPCKLTALSLLCSTNNPRAVSLFCQADQGSSRHGDKGNVVEPDLKRKQQRWQGSCIGE